MSVPTLLNYTYTNWEGEWELVDGSPISMPLVPIRIYQNITTEILFALKSTLDEESCAKCVLSYENDWKITEETVLRVNDETVKLNIYHAEEVQYHILVRPDDLKAKVYSLENNFCITSTS